MKLQNLLLVPFLLALLLGTDVASQRTDRLPRLVLWSWEHNDRLEFVDPEKAAVAYYAGTIMMGRDTATFLQRRNQVQLARTIVSFPVFRLENAHRDQTVSAASFSSARQLINTYMKEHSHGYIQIDFDAKENDRHGYLQFLQQLRNELPGKTYISITALGSWCLSDKWLQAAPVDETVAMMFSMGEGKSATLSALANNKLDSGAAATQSLGLSINEAKTNQQLQRLGCIRNTWRVYAFSPLGWTKRRYDRLLTEVNGL